MNVAAQMPGLSFQAVPPAGEIEPLRSDVAGFAGRTTRGPIGLPVRVEGWRAAGELFGSPGDGATGWALRGYFQNAGQVAHVVRLAGPGTVAAAATWAPGAAGGRGFPWLEYLLAASSPGLWGNGLTVSIAYRRDGVRGAPEVDLAIRPAGEPAELLSGISAERLPEEVAARSRYLRVYAPGVEGPADPLAGPAPLVPPRRAAFSALLTGGTDGPAPGAAAATVSVGVYSPSAGPAGLAGDGLAWPSYRFVARRPGTARNGTRIELAYARDAGSPPTVDVAVTPPAGEPERWPGLPAAGWLDALNARSALVEVAAPEAGPRFLAFPDRVLGGGDEVAPGPLEYAAAATALGELEEVALVALPDLHADLVPADAAAVHAALLARADELHDRLVLVDLPVLDDVRARLGWLDGLAALAGDTLRNAAVYEPGVEVPDPARLAEPVRALPPSGHVAGLVSRLDRERGAHHTPANAEVLEAVDLARAPGREELGQLLADGRVNLLRCFPGRGILVWGGRTPDPDQRFVAHRRLVHRLVRAIRRAAAPLVFDVNGPELWLALVRAVTTVLTAAWEGGALAGARREEAFTVRCDETTNPPAARDDGLCLCEIGVAPAAPMEFILIRVALSADGTMAVSA